MSKKGKRKREKNLMDMDNSVVIARGRQDRGEVEGIWGINDDGQRLNLGWRIHNTINR